MNDSLMTRRDALRIGGLTLVLTPWSVVAAADGTRAGFEFVVVNDTHYVDQDCRAFQGAVASAMRRSAPDAVFCAHAGDVTDRGDAIACAAMKELYEKEWERFYPVPGNHDFISKTDRSGYDASFPDRLNYFFEHRGWQFIGLDTTQDTTFDETVVSATTFAWLEDTIPNLEAKAPTFVFTHFPLGEGVVYRPINADAIAKRLAELNVKWIHCGHWHGDSVRRAGNLTASTSRCCARLRENRDGSPLKGWHVYFASADGKLSRRFVEIPKV